jgi:hypothetical protein
MRNLNGRLRFDHRGLGGLFSSLKTLLNANKLLFQGYQGFVLEFKVFKKYIYKVNNQISQQQN